MSRIAIVAALFGMALVVISVGQTSEAYGMGRTNIITLRIDNTGHVWWNPKSSSPENLPRLLPSYPHLPDSGSFAVDAQTLHNFLFDQIEPNRRLAARIIVHPDAHYVWLSNFLTIVEQVEAAMDSVIASEKGVAVDSLSKHDRYALEYYIWNWEPRDDMILNEVTDASCATRQRTDSIPMEYRFATKLEAGHWDYLGDTVFHHIRMLAEWAAREDRPPFKKKQVLYRHPIELTGVTNADRLEFSIPVKVSVSADGRVTEAELTGSTGTQSLDESVLEAAGKWLFFRKVVEGQPVARCTTITIEYPHKR